MAVGDKKSSTSGVAKAGMNLFKKLVYENYETPNGDKRESERQQVVGEVSVTLLDQSGTPAATTRAFVRNTSKGGCGIWSRIAMPVGGTLMISGLGAPGEGAGASAGQQVQRMAKVKHCRGAAGTGFAVGVKFEADEQAMKRAG
jgi:hypothetical protein